MKYILLLTLILTATVNATSQSITPRPMVWLTQQQADAVIRDLEDGKLCYLDNTLLRQAIVVYEERLHGKDSLLMNYKSAEQFLLDINALRTQENAMLTQEVGRLDKKLRRSKQLTTVTAGVSLLALLFALIH
jgi:hypothetical protein